MLMEVGNMQDNEIILLCNMLRVSVIAGIRVFTADMLRVSVIAGIRVFTPDMF